MSTAQLSPVALATPGAAGSRRFDTACHKTPAAPPMQRTLLRVTLVLFGALTAAALRQHGPTPHHRTSFAPVAQMQLV